MKCRNNCRHADASRSLYGCAATLVYGRAVCGISLSSQIVSKLSSDFLFVSRMALSTLKINIKTDLEQIRFDIGFSFKAKKEYETRFAE